MPKGSCFIAKIAGLKISARRAVVFLVRNGEVNGKSIFDGLPANRDREVRNRFDHWIDGNNAPAKYFHGWDNAKYDRCFCFKWKESGVHQRLYGFLCNPKRDNPRFQLCVL